MAEYNRNRRGGRRPNHNRNQQDQQQQQQRRDRRESGDVIWEPRRPRGERAPEPKPSLFKRILSVVTFGLAGGAKKPAAPKRPAPSAPAARNGQSQDQQRDARKPRGEFRGDRPERSREDRPREDRPREDRPRDDRPRPERSRSERPASEQRPIDPPNPDAITSERLHIGNLNYDTTEGDLFDLFNGVGKVKNVEIVTNRHTQRSKGFGFVQMQGIPEAKRAVEVLHGQEFMGRKLIIGPARSAGEREPGARGERPAQTDAGDPETAQA